MALRHLFKKKVDIGNKCFAKTGECKYLEREFINGGMERLLFCQKCEKYLKHSDANNCEFYEANNAD